MTEKEKKLIKGCKEGKSEAQKQLYLEYGPLVKGICLRYTGNESEAEDLFHDTFVFILTNFGHFKEITSLNGWLRRITINKAIDHYRSQSYRRTDSLDEIIEVPQAQVSGDSILTMNQLVGFINELPDKYRTAFNLYEVDGFEQKEISEIMGETLSNVRSLISRAKSILRARIRIFLNHEEFKLD